jgi:hypothetical protein
MRPGRLCRQSSAALSGFKPELEEAPYSLRLRRYAVAIAVIFYLLRDLDGQ